MSTPSEQRMHAPQAGKILTHHTDAQAPLIAIDEHRVDDVDWGKYGGALLLVLGGFYVILGVIASIIEEWSVLANRDMLVGDVHLWGWILAGWGVVVTLTGIAVVRNPPRLRRVAIGVAGASILVSYAALSAFPLSAAVQMLLGGLVLYGLVARQGRSDQAAQAADGHDQEPGVRPSS